MADPYCLRTVVCKGYKSVTFIADFYRRAEKAIEQDQQPIILYFGDLDPSGVQMLEATRETLESELGLEGVEFRRVGLNPDQVKKFNLLHDPEAVKLSDTRSSAYIKKYGELAVELDAIHPGTLAQLTRDAIEQVIEMDFFREHKELEKKDTRTIGDLRSKVLKFIHREIKNV